MSTVDGIYVGVDLSHANSRTSIAVIHDGEVCPTKRPHEGEVCLDRPLPHEQEEADQWLVDLIERRTFGSDGPECDTIAIDTPFTFPQGFLTALRKDQDVTSEDFEAPKRMDALRYRQTERDLEAELGPGEPRPLSSSLDALTWLVLRLWHAMGGPPRFEPNGSLDNRVFETYPSAVRRKLSAVMDLEVENDEFEEEVCEKLGLERKIEKRPRARVVDSHDRDAIICAVAAWYADEEELEEDPQFELEGYIQVPSEGWIRRRMELAVSS